MQYFSPFIHTTLFFSFYTSLFLTYLCINKDSSYVEEDNAGLRQLSAYILTESSSVIFFKI